jgi:PAS domain S-box-containing protein
MTRHDKFADRGDDEERHMVQPVVHAAASPNALQRQRAEARLRQNVALAPEDVAALSPAATQSLLHELRVHQIELEMQNEELRESQLALDAARERYFDLYDLAPVGYCTISEQGLIVQANLTAASLFGMVRGALLKQRVSRRILKEDQDIYYLHRKRLVEQGDLQAFDLRMVKNDGTQFWAHLTMTVGHDAAGTPELRAVLDDITERKQTEAERGRFHQVLQGKNLELERATAVAEKANQAKSDFLSSMSHELRTPLNAILGFGQLMENGPTPLAPEQKESARQILKAGWHLLNLINEILDLATIESGKLTMLQDSMPLSEVLQDCKAMMEPQAQEHGIQMTFPHIGNLFFIRADRNRVKQVIINLLSNAIKYNRVGGAVIVQCAASGGNRVRISVKDEGVGLAPEQLAHLFEPFNRLGQWTGSEEGTGIGLVITKQLVELMGGVVGVESEVGVGSVFWVELPTGNLPENAPGGIAQIAPLEQDHPEALASGRHRWLLYVEDNPANLALVEQLIARRSDLKLLSAINGEMGTQFARLYRPDLILMDINLPGISGFDALKILREDPATAHIPVVALSANAIPSDIEKGIKAGFFCYLTKPIIVNEFMETLDAVLLYSAENHLSR